MIKLKQHRFLLVTYKLYDKICTYLERKKYKARYAVYHSKFKHIGLNVIFDNNVLIIKPEKVSIGQETFIGRDTILNAGRGSEIYIGKYCAVAADCKFITWNHKHDSKEIGIKNTGEESKDIVINDGCWFGYNCIVLPGVRLGEGCVVAAGTVVTKSFEDFSIIGGVPAQKIDERKTKKEKKL